MLNLFAAVAFAENTVAVRLSNINGRYRYANSVLKPRAAGFYDLISDVDFRCGFLVIRGRLRGNLRVATLILACGRLHRTLCALIAGVRTGQK